MQVSENFMIMFNLSVMFVFFGFLIKSWYEWRRIKLKNQLNHKLLDKFGATEELSRFLETNGGKGFLDAMTIQSLNPMEKIFSSITKGIFLFCLGIGFFLVGFVVAEETQVFNAFGIMGVALGVGYMISTYISYNLSKKWGIINPAAEQE